MADSLLSSICSLCVCCVNSVVYVSICILSSTSASSLLNFSFMVARSAGVSDMRDLLVVVSPMVPVCLSVVEM